MSPADTFRRAILFIYRHLDEPLSIDRVAEAVDVSPSTLKRLFAEQVETSPGALIRRLRLELALRTLRSRDESVIETALAAGFSDHAAFSRSFRRAFGFAPSGARQRLHLVDDLEAVELAEPERVELADFTIQAVTAQGYYFDCAPRAWRDLGERLAGAPDDDVEGCLYIGVSLDDPHQGEVAEDQVRFVAGVHGLATDLGVERRAMPGGVFARFRYHGKIARIGLAYHHIFGAWRGRAGATLRSAPTFLMLEAPPSVDGDTDAMICVPIA